MRRAALFVATALALLVPLVWFGGCTSQPLPPAAGAASPRFEVSVGVEADRVAPFSNELVRALRASGCFAEVDLVDRLQRPPDLLAKVEHGWQANAAIPFFTVLSLGLIPTIADETYGLAFSLRARAAPEQPVLLETRWRGRVWFGLVAPLLNIAPGRTSEDWRTQSRWIEHLRSELARNRAALEPLTSAAADRARARR